jgi:hypothetical protein
MAGFMRVASAPVAPGAVEDSGFCRQPGHGNFEANKYCKACDTCFCIKCTALHIGHENGDAGGFDRVVSAPSVNPQVSAERSQFDDQMAQFRRTSSASSQAAAVCAPNQPSDVCFTAVCGKAPALDSLGGFWP